MTRTSVSRHEAEQLLQRAQGNPDWLAQLREAYGGRHDVLDALWWTAHPLTDSPRGKPDPAAQTRELQRAAFSRGGAQSELVDVVDPVTGARVQASAAGLRLRELQDTLARDAAQLKEAVERVTESVPAAEMTAPEEVSEPVLAVPEAPAVGVSLPHDEDNSRRTRVIAIVVAVVLAALVLPGIPGVVTGLSGGSPEASPPPVTSLEPVPLSAGGQVPPPLEMLADPSQEIESPIRSLGVLEPMRNFRGLPMITEHSAWYLANGEDGDICLLAATIGGTAMTRCISEADFLENGISLGMAGTYILDTGITRKVEEESFTLFPDGTFSYDAMVIDAPRRPH